MTIDTALSVLDLSPIAEGSDAAQAFANTADLARQVEALGFGRYWLAEHHNMPGIGCAATAVLIGHVAGATRKIRVGAGGIMLPNHAPLVIAEQFGTLAALYPGRIELGLGRAPGTDQRTMAALRRTLAGDVDGFPRGDGLFRTIALDVRGAPTAARIQTHPGQLPVAGAFAAVLVRDQVGLAFGIRGERGLGDRSGRNRGAGCGGLDELST